MVKFIRHLRSILQGIVFTNALVFAATDSVPVWLDTVPPVISIDPSKKIHSTIFSVKLTSNERAAIWYGINSMDSMKPYTNPFSITTDGVWSVYYYGEDDFANKSTLKSVQYTLDQKPPQMILTPKPGIYPQGTILKILTDESCRLILLQNQNDSAGEKLDGVISLKNDIAGYILAIDMCGNRKVTEKINYKVDTSHAVPVIQPEEGLYNTETKIRFANADKLDIFYSFDPLEPKEWFKKYTSAATLPYGITVVRFYGKSSSGLMTEVYRKKYTIDTAAPVLISRIGKGTAYDTVTLTTKEPSVIRYTVAAADVSEECQLYKTPVIIPHRGRVVFRSRAWDEAGNESELFKWECRYDFTKPVIQLSSPGGTFTKQQKVFVTSSKPAMILYTLNGSAVDSNSMLYNSIDGISVSREDSTILRCKAIDDAGNESDEKIVRFFIDSKPPQIKVKISGKMQDGSFQVHLTADEESRIYFETNGSEPGNLSPLYNGPVTLKNGQILKYLAIDRCGNRSRIFTMDELVKPRVEAHPDGGIFNKVVKVSFLTNTSGQVYWRILPDTVFRPLTDSLKIDNEGIYSLEYYIESADGISSPVRRSEYTVDWTAPYVQINIKKGVNDSIIIFFESNENASIYYTTDNSNPLYSSTSRTAGNKYTQSKDRIIIPRKKDTRLAFIAEDIAQNQSAVSILDVSSPRAVPNVPSGKDKLYDRILSVSLNTPDQSIIYFCRHGHTPTTDSAIYREPVTLLESDTILAFVIDASGYRGQIDTFVYRIDLPPQPQFKIISDQLIIGKEVVFDASESIDKETPFENLLFRWDFDGDGKFDTDEGRNFRVSHKYIKAGNYKVNLEITDGNKRTAQAARTVIINSLCPEDMVSVNTVAGHHYCIDKYEWPNTENELPQTKVSWVEAKMACIDAGKRLCTAVEWENACRGINGTAYPYGNKYEVKRCPDKGKNVARSGGYKNCSSSKIGDMIGNVWEWVEDKNGDYPLMYGGTYEYGKNANCALRAEGNVASRSGETGFRCCK